MGSLFWVRATAAALGATGVVCLLVKRRAVGAGLRTFFLEPQPPINLGLARCLIFSIVFANAVSSPASWFASLPAEFQRLPYGWVWAEGLLPLSVEWTRALERVLVVSSALATVGLLTRPACIISSVVGVYVFAVPNLYFKVGHGLQVPVLSGFILSASGAGDAFSLDALVRRLRGAPRALESSAYTLPVRFCWLLVGTMYLFPGLWKVWANGDQWVDGTKLHSTLLLKWVDSPDYIPYFRPDHWPFVLVFLGVSTLVFEVGFFFSLFQRTARVVAGLSAVAFHVGIGLTTAIWFNPVYPLIVLFDFPQILQLPGLRRLSVPVQRMGARLEVWLSSSGLRAGAVRASPRRSPVPPAIVGAVLVLLMMVAGARGIHSFPVSVYPKFNSRSARLPAKASTLAFRVVSVHGKERKVSPTFYPIEDTAVIRRLVASALKREPRGQPVGGPRLDLVARIVRENCGPFRRGERLRIYEYSFAVDPEKRRKKPKLRLITEIPL